MSERAAAAAAQIEALRDEILRTVEPLTDQGWHSPTAAEGWPVGYATRHIAAGIGQCQTWVEAACSGAPAQVDRDAIDAANAAGLAVHGAGQPAEILELVRARAAALATLVRSLTDAQLDSPALVSPAGSRSVEMVATDLLARHTRTHLDSIRSALSAPQR